MSFNMSTQPQGTISIQILNKIPKFASKKKHMPVWVNSLHDKERANTTGNSKLLWTQLEWLIMPFRDSNILIRIIHIFQKTRVVHNLQQLDISLINSLAPGRSERDSRNIISYLILLIGIFRSSHDNTLWWMPQDLTDDKSTLVQVMAWCRQAPSHYLNQCWLSSLLPYSFARPQWVNAVWPTGHFHENSSKLPNNHSGYSPTTFTFTKILQNYI